jgi:hypothetical protein
MRDFIKAKGVYEFKNLDTGEIIKKENVVCQNFFTPTFEAMKNNTSALDVLSFATGDGTTSALKSDTALDNEIFRKNITSITSDSTKVTIKTTLATSESNFNIKEVGLFFSDGGILSRANEILKKTAVFNI